MMNTIYQNPVLTRDQSVIVLSNERQEKSIPASEMRGQQEVLDFEFPDLVTRISKEMELANEEAQALFKDMLRFLYMSGTHPDLRPFYPPPAIDEAWHTFLLFTREYEKFCHKHFGSFIHHSPLTEAMRQARAEGRTKPDCTLDLAKSLFGNLSGNWAKDTQDCEQSCAPSRDCNS